MSPLFRTKLTAVTYSTEASSGTKSGVSPRKFESTEYDMGPKPGWRKPVTVEHESLCVLRTRVSLKCKMAPLRRVLIVGYSKKL